MFEALQTSLVLMEQAVGQIKPASLRAVSAAHQLGRPYALLCIGHEIHALAENLVRFGSTTVYLADHETLAEPIAERYAMIIADLVEQEGFRTLLAASSTFSRDVLPRVAALIDAPMLTDVVQIQVQTNQTVFQRPVNAGCELARVTLQSDRRVLTIRPGAFEEPQAFPEESTIRSLNILPNMLPDSTVFVGREQRPSQRPELSTARVVVAGGRPIKDRQTYERLVGRLADTFSGAVGATRALVDAGVVPNDWQIGQTGKVLAPELYIAMGISGAVQHLAGIRDARVIVAINTDPNAPLMNIATYALQGDMFELVPRLIEMLESAD
jgi:electron transfer flavoprotein alpha subunit